MNFNPLDGEVVLYMNGVYRQRPLFEMDGQIYAKHGTGFVSLKENSNTSKNKLYWKNLVLDHSYDSHIGNLVLTQRPS